MSTQTAAAPSIKPVVTLQTLRDNALRVQEYLTRADNLTALQRQHIADRITVILLRDECKIFNVVKENAENTAPMPRAADKEISTLLDRVTEILTQEVNN